MRELIYVPLELSKESKKTCDFCSKLENKDNHSVRQIVTRVKSTSRWISDDVVCEECEEKFFNDEIPKCERCGRLQTKGYKDFFSGKYTCYCVSFNEDIEEKDLPNLPQERESMTAFYERQINALQEKESQLTEEVDTHLEALEVAEDWHKRQKQELLDEIANLKKENGQARVVEVNKLQVRIKELEKEIDNYKEEIRQLKKQNEQTAQIETPAKEKGLKGFFKFGSK